MPHILESRKARSKARRRKRAAYKLIEKKIRERFLELSQGRVVEAIEFKVGCSQNKTRLWLFTRRKGEGGMTRVGV